MRLKSQWKIPIIAVISILIISVSLVLISAQEKYSTPSWAKSIATQPIESIDVTTDQYWYRDGDLIKISGKVVPDNSAIFVTLVITGPDRGVFTSSQLSPLSDGSFSYDGLRAGEPGMVPGEYVLIVQYGLQKGTTTFGILE